MKAHGLRSRIRNNCSHKVFPILICLALLSLGQSISIAQEATSSPQAQTQESASPSPAAATGAAPVATPSAPPASNAEASTFSNDQLDSLVAPIALYPDPLLAQTLAASTYPLEVIQLYQWLQKNKKLKDKALADAVAKQPFDSSVQSLALYPEVLERMSGNIKWTTELGNAFLAQQSDVMNAVQRMRAKAEGKGTLTSDWHQKVEKKSEEGKEVITIEPADPQVVYVPSYDPQYMYGPPVYPWYDYYYPGYLPGYGYWFGAGIIIGGIWGGWWGDCDWHGGDINIDRNNRFNRNQVNPLRDRGQGNRWQHNPAHRGNAPYADRRTSDKFGNRGQGDRRGQANRPGAGNRPSQRSASGKRPGGGTAKSTRPTGGAKAGRSARSNASRASTRPSGANAGNRVGNRSVSSSPSYSNRGGTFGGSSSGYRSNYSSNRGGYSMGGGGFSRGGFGGGGGFRGGGGGFRGGGGGRRR
jgi:hypothetical protein